MYTNRGYQGGESGEEGGKENKSEEVERMMVFLFDRHYLPSSKKKRTLSPDSKK